MSSAHSRRNLATLTLSAVLIGMIAGPGVTRASIIGWTGDQANDGNYDGSFGLSNNWNPAQVPGSGDDAVFNTGSASTYTVTLTQDQSVNGLTFAGDTITVDVATHKLTFEDNGVQAKKTLIVGDSNLTTHLTLTSTASSGQGSVKGALNDQQLYIGKGANSNTTMTINNGVTFLTNDYSHLGNTDTASATLTVTGTGTSAAFNRRGLSFGSAAGGVTQLNVLDGASYTGSGNKANIVLSATGGGDSQLLVDDASMSSWNLLFGGGSTSQLHTGVTAGVTIRNGGTANFDSIAYVSSDKPTRTYGKDININVTGAGSTLTVSNNFYLGGEALGGSSHGAIEGDSDATISDNGLLNVGSLLQIWGAADTNNDGTYGDASTLTLDNGTVAISGGDAGAKTPLLPGQLVNQGRLRGNGTILRQTGTDATVYNIFIEAGGVLQPGDLADNTPGIGTLNVLDGNVILNAGIFDVDLDATTSDLLAIFGGGLTLSGNDTLNFNELGTPTAASYTLATFDSLAGTFANVYNLPVGYHLNYNLNSITLTGPQQVTAVPEPTSVAMLLLGLGTLAMLPRRNRRFER